MKKLIWITFFSALVVVNLLAMAADYFGGVYIAIPYRLVMILAITLIGTIFGGAWVLMRTAESEQPNTGRAKQDER
ncbi:hypothetical protein [Pseudohongiella sp. O18]|uniref:hypothetical protein n=1 Tax=Pseudohongiella sp. O18 TaxID=2904248 RepID=UPI001F311507|nr:hypothetical protein [Pseudohongiella sp. O18]